MNDSTHTVLDLKGVHVHVVHAQQDDGVLHVEAHEKGLHKVRRLLDGARVLGLLVGLAMNGRGFERF